MDSNINEILKAAVMIYVVMGVSSSGKTTIGQHLAQRLGIPFYDADDFHPPANIAKMKAGIPLNDDDRMPWLQTMASAMRDWERVGDAVLACSALKEAYRQILRGTSKHVVYILLKGDRELILKRMQARQGHFFPPSLLDSQMATLEEPTDGIAVDIDAPPDAIVEQILKALSGKSLSSATAND